MRLPLKLLLLVGIPLVIMGGIGLMLLGEGDTDNARSTFAVGVIIAAVSGASVIYQVERWRLLRQTLIHLAVMTVTVLPAILLSGWFDLSTGTGWLLALGVFALTGVALWLIFYVIFAILDRRQRRFPASDQ